MTVRDTIVAPTEREVKIKNIKLYIPVVTSSTENDAKLLKELESELQRTINWNKIRNDYSS